MWKFYNNHETDSVEKYGVIQVDIKEVYIKIPKTIFYFWTNPFLSKIRKKKSLFYLLKNWLYSSPTVTSSVL